MSLLRSLSLCCFALSGLLAPLVQAQNSPQLEGLSHVEFRISDLEQSLQFYTQLFGTNVWHARQGEQVFLKLGTSYLALTQHNATGVLHSGLALTDFDANRVQQYLEVQGIRSEQVAAGAVQVTDGDYIHTQFVDAHEWETRIEPGGIREPVTASSQAIFKALLLDEIYITVTNMEVDSLFYSRMLGLNGSPQAGSLFFDLGNARLRLSQAPVGQAPGVNYVAILVSNIDMDTAAEAVFAAGGIIETILPNGFSFWDPDGLRVVVRTTGMY
jgi:catechol 2,3-dioxygenase-like lactoylglutathione lyase family enzyme